MFPLRIAIRYLFSKKTHNAVNIISLISLAGVAVATMAIVCVLSVFNGFSDLSAAHLSILDPDLKITPVEGKSISSVDSLIYEIEQIDGIDVAIPTIEEQALAIYGERQMPVMIKGVPLEYENTTGIKSIVIDGDFYLTDSIASYATLSVGAAIGLGATPSLYRYLGIYTPKREGRVNVANPMTAFRSDSLIVAGVYQVAQAEYDTDMVILPIENAARLLDYDNEATAIEVMVKPSFNISKVTAQLQTILGDELIVKDRLHQQEQSFRMIEIEKWITFLMLAFILIIASFNIISTLSMLVIEKSENIHTLHSLGATSTMISRIFMLEGWLISIVGGIAGVIIGVILTLAQQWGGFIKLSGDPSALSIDHYPVRLDVMDLFVVMGLVIVIGFFTAQITALFTRKKIR
ncbi:MAG: FtsX-like permease family protein [Muribaculaceae bacterium]|nr:FtsX-like permease family protein [Muribaculaceae bacterium]